LKLCVLRVRQLQIVPVEIDARCVHNQMRKEQSNVTQCLRQT